MRGAGREGTSEKRGGEREAREGWTGWIRRLAAIDFSRQTRGLFVPLLVLVLLPLSVPFYLSFSLSRFPLAFPRARCPVPRVSGSLRLHRVPSILAHILSLSLSLALLLVNVLPPFDSRSVLFSLSPPRSLFLPLSLCFSFLHAFASGDVSVPFLCPSLSPYHVSFFLVLSLSIQSSRGI